MLQDLLLSMRQLLLPALFLTSTSHVLLLELMIQKERILLSQRRGLTV
jgi:hypothetical protein